MIISTNDPKNSWLMVWESEGKKKNNLKGPKEKIKLKSQGEKPFAIFAVFCNLLEKKLFGWQKILPSVFALLRHNSVWTQPGIRPNPAGKVHLNSFPHWWSLKHIQLLCGATSISELTNEPISKNLPWPVHLTWLSCALIVLWSKFKP